VDERVDRIGSHIDISSCGKNFGMDVPLHVLLDATSGLCLLLRRAASSIINDKI
jgi:hypothetical protein